MRSAFIFSLLFAVPLVAQDKKPEPPPPVAGVDEVKVAQAIEKGIAFLRTAKSPDFHNAYRTP